ncbi:saccharopine dehydrogenase NADP-binding domain-containing protein [Plantactinospora mayteni]|uniref:Saccharopine dehydrogenase n=1 Tax=Plantactinospora mayteni TaxID=566021 RepID=A0ABQ4F4M1_9ACTN|nr:saccharopine dehydrogenase NADP-binding domain-containing protein [Plantactinospora mayteni]GIH01825.1 saccharopine dehydrogenase [Plantactinospora mayteni]
MKIAVYGASGYQAKLVLAELAHRNIDMLLIGRNANRLREAATTVGIIDAAQRVADTDDHDALVAASRECDAVINCAGPFTSSGHAVVRAAVAAGCHYVDTAGEQLYTKTVFDTFAREAERAGVTVVPATNDGCVPGDLIARLLAGRLQPIEEITISHFIVGGGGMSRGSLRSAVETIDALKAGGLSYDDGDWRTGTPARHATVTLPGARQPTEVVKCPLSEVVTIPRHVPVRHVESLVDAAVGAQLSTPLTPQIIDSLPEGPTEEDRRTQRFTYLIDAVGRNGQFARGVVQGHDTYGITAVIAVEAARRLVADGAKPGVLAPAQAYDPTSFLDFLAPYGISWTISLSDTPPARQ